MRVVITQEDKSLERELEIFADDGHRCVYLRGDTSAGEAQQAIDNLRNDGYHNVKNEDVEWKNLNWKEEDKP